MTQPFNAGLRFVEAGELDSRVLDLDDLDVTNRRGDDLGELDGFLVDAASGRPRYVVVDSGGWFHSKRFAVPVSQATYDSELRTLSLDLDRETIGRFPSFDDDRFERWTPESWREYDDGVSRVVTPATITRGQTDRPAPAAAWWSSGAWTEYGHDAGRDEIRRDYREEVVSRERAADDVARDDRLAAERYVRDVEHHPVADRDVVRTDADYGTRAQPGDILGIESGGERTGIGDTAEDEDRRREQAERDVRELPTDKRDRR